MFIIDVKSATGKGLMSALDLNAIDHVFRPARAFGTPTNRCSLFYLQHFKIESAWPRTRYVKADPSCMVASSSTRHLHREYLTPLCHITSPQHQLTAASRVQAPAAAFQRWWRGHAHHRPNAVEQLLADRPGHPGIAARTAPVPGQSHRLYKSKLPLWDLPRRAGATRTACCASCGSADRPQQHSGPPWR